MLAIEIDGMSHNHEEVFSKDETRQQKLESFGIRFLRFAEYEVKHDMLNVLRTIESAVVALIKNAPSVKLPEGFDRSLLE